jgi:hypothetical protein
MDNQHRKIRGYRELSQAEIDLMNKIKEQGLALAALITEVQLHHKAQRAACTQTPTAAGDEQEQERLRLAEPERWASIGRTHFQEGLMALTRSVAQPGFF